MIKRISVVLLVVATMSLTAIAQSSSSASQNSKRLDLGRLQDGIYTNDFFGLSVSVPRDWIVLSANQREQIVEDSKKLIETPDQKKKEQLSESIDRTTSLLSLTKLHQGLPNNAAFMLVAERVPWTSFKTGVDVLNSIAEMGKGTNITLEFVEPIHTERVGGVEFGVATMKNTSPFGSFLQKAYITMKNGYAIQFFFTYLDAADVRTFDSIMKSVSIK